MKPLTQEKYEDIKEESKRFRSRKITENIGTRIFGARYPDEYDKICEKLESNKIFRELKARGKILITEVGPGIHLEGKEPGIKIIINGLGVEKSNLKVQVVDTLEGTLKEIKRTLPDVDIIDKNLNIIYERIPGKSDLCICVNVFWNTPDWLESNDMIISFKAKGLLFNEYHSMFDNLVGCIKPGGYLVVDQVPREQGDYSELHEAIKKVDLDAYGLKHIDGIMLNEKERKIAIILKKVKEVKIWK